jgi:IPT/TIG domain
MATQTFNEYWASGSVARFWAGNPVGAQAKLLAMDAVAKTSDELVLGEVRPAILEVEGGTVVEIEGSNMTGTTGVTFGGTAGTDLVVVNDNLIRVTSPAKTADTVDVVVAHPKGNVTLTDAVEYI